MPTNIAQQTASFLEGIGGPSQASFTSVGQTNVVSSSLSVSTFTTQSNTPIVPIFGTYNPQASTFPSDQVYVNIFNVVDRFLETSYSVSAVYQTGTVVTIDVEKTLQDLGYISGKYNTEFKFIRNYLGTGDGVKLRIQEISSNGLEIRVVPVLDQANANNAFATFFADGFFQIPKAQVLSNLYAFKDGITFIPVFDYIQDRFTFSSYPYSIIIKLAVPAASTFAVGDLIWVAQEVTNPLLETITLSPPKLGADVKLIGPPNWNAVSNQVTSFGTEYKDWDDLLTTNSATSQDIVNRLFSGSLIEGIPLNIDFRRFENFVHFGSATERLRNFQYKIQLIEGYDSRIKALTTDLNGLPSSSVSGSLYFLNNVLDAQNKRSNLLGTFDAYEKYLYYESSSYVTNSYGEFYPTTWPKSNSTPPYVNYSFTSSQAQEWFDGIIQSSSLFDQNNLNALTKLIPAHVVEDPSNEQYLLFVSMIGHYFDLIYAYVKQITLINDRNQSISEGFSKELIAHLIDNLGVPVENGSSYDELWSYVLGTDVSGSYQSSYGISSKDRTNEVWKRLVNNLPYLLKTKGTERGVRALINCFGIPRTILRIREFGGPEPEFNNRTDYTYDIFFYSTEVGTPASYSISVPWRQLTESGGSFPNTVELRVKMHPSQSGDQDIMVAPAWSVQAVDGSKLRLTTPGGTVSFTSSIYDGTFHHLSVVNNGSNITLYARKTNYEKVVSTTSGSVAGSSWGSPTVTSNLQIPGTANPFSGSVQELRYWSSALDSRILDNHALAPTSFQGNDSDVYSGSTSSFYDLAFRLTLGSDNNKINYALTASISSSHPNQSITRFSTGQLKTGSFINYTNTASIAHVEIHSLEWPDLGANRTVSNKIRIDNTFVAGDTQLFPNVSVVRSVSDNNPIDSPRLGVYLSPTNEVDQDIAEQFGGLSIDDFIGDPSYYELNNYPALDQLKREYYKKYTWLPSGSLNTRNKGQNYIRLLRYYDSALFQLIKKFVPHRANTQVGLVIEPTMLDRSKIPSKLPELEDLSYSSSINLPDVYTVGGFVQDGDGEPFRDIQGYVEEGVIAMNQADYLRPGGFIQDGDGEPFRDIPGYVQEGVLSKSEDEQPSSVAPDFEVIDYDYVIFDETIKASPTTGGEAYVYKKILTNSTGSGGGFQFGTAEDTINLRESGYGRDLAGFGSQYTFFTYATSGSGPTRSEPYLISSSRYDYSDPLGAVVLDGRRSETSNDGTSPYDQDIFGGKAFGTYIDNNPSQNNIILTGSGIFDFDFTNRFGLSVNPKGPTPSVAVWKTEGVIGRLTAAGAGSVSNPKTLSIPAFFFKEHNQWTHNLQYEVNLTAYSNADFYLTCSFGSQNSNFTTFISSSNFSSITDTFSTVTFTSKADGPYLWFTIPTGGIFSIKDLKVRCLNYSAQVQDYHLHNSLGMVNARYNGCKMTSADWNIDSPDTIDGGPVVTITLGGGTDLVTRPSQRGTFEVRGTDAAGNPKSTGGGRSTSARGTALVN